MNIHLTIYILRISFYSNIITYSIKPLKSSSNLNLKKKNSSNVDVEDNIQIENNKEALKLMLIENQKSDESRDRKEDIITNINVIVKI